MSDQHKIYHLHTDVYPTENPDVESGKRSILIGGLTKNTPLEKVINAFQRLELTGGGRIQNFDLFDNDKIRITYLNKQDAERVLSKGNPFKIENTLLFVSKFTNEDLVEKQHREPNFDNSAQFIVKKSSLESSFPNSTETTDLAMVDRRRIILTNVLSFLDQDFLELYIEYLSNEADIERFDMSREIKDTIVVTFEKDIDFDSVKKKHDLKPNLMNVKTDLYPVYQPDTVIIETKENTDNFQLNKEILELYFSNRKRSGGENVKHVRLSSKDNRIAYVTFNDFESAKRVTFKKNHQINKINFECKLYYKNIGPDPFSYSKNLFKNSKKAISIKNEYKRSKDGAYVNLTAAPQLNPLEELHQRTFYKRPAKSQHASESTDANISKLEKKFDPNKLTNQQTGYLLELQSIYNELNNSNLTLFTTEPNVATKELATAQTLYQNMLGYEESLINKKEAQPPRFAGFSLDKNENQLKYLSEFIVDNQAELNAVNKTASCLSNDTELEESQIQKYHYKGNTFEDDRKLNDFEPKPLVNLPRLDDMISFEEYQYLNNLNGKNLAQNQVYSEAKKEAKPIVKSYINPSEFNPYYKTAMSQFSTVQKEIECNASSQMVQSNVSASLKNSSENSVTAHQHKALRNINFATRRQPRVIYKSRDRPPPPKLIRLNNSKKADPDEQDGLVEIQVPLGSISTLKSGSQPISVPLCSIIMMSPTPTSSEAHSNTANPINSETTTTSATTNASNLRNSKNPKHRYSLLCNSTTLQRHETNTPVISTVKSKSTINRRSLNIDTPTLNLVPSLLSKSLFPSSYRSKPSNKENAQNSVVILNSTPISFPSKFASTTATAMVDQSVQHRAICMRPPPVPNLISKVGKSVEILKTNDDSSVKKVRIINKERRLTQINNNHITEQYGRLTEASSINKLDSNALEFFKQTKYLSYLRLIYPKLSINLNENLKNLYFFGAKNQVTDAKLKVTSDLNEFKSTEFLLEHKEMADFLQRPEVRKKILKFVNTYISDQENSLKRKSDTDGEHKFKIYFCNFQVKNLKGNKENIDSEHSLVINTNLYDFENILSAYINNVIAVNHKIEVPPGNSIINSIRNQDEHWMSIYTKYSKSLDFCLESYKEKVNILKEIKLNQKLNPKRWFIKLTGFKEEIEKFQFDIEKCFI